ncbi:MAG: CsbD family protein [Labilithrix sp.]|nr:CsbD family protein [Labilithrix sp.]
MSSQGNRVTGKAEEIGGGIKKKIGETLGNERMEAEGLAKQKEGEARQEAAKASERAKGKAEEAKGAAKKAVGGLIGDEQMEAEGTATDLKGEARQKANQ